MNWYFVECPTVAPVSKETSLGSAEQNEQPTIRSVATATTRVVNIFFAFTKEMKELLGYMSRHHEDLEKSFTDEQKETFEKFHDCWSEYMSLAEAAIFEYAFKFGMQIAIETLTE